jgi:type II secretory pathway component GspD/PulD (secretin)
MPSPPVVFYLKYAKPDDAIRVLAELLDGGESAMDAVAGSLVNGFVTSSSSFLTSFVTSRDGTTTMISGTITVVADSRLNRLIAQGTASDIELIEDYLEIIDKDNSITSIETYGTSHVIELTHISANEAAAVIREAYAGRIAGAAGSSGGRQSNQQGGQQQGQRVAAAAKPATPNQEGEAKKPTAAPKRQGNQPARNLEPQMTIAVHEPSNTLIVTAPDQLFRQVEQLVKLLDVRSEQSIGIVTTTNGAALEMMLQRALSGGTRSSTGSSGRTESSQRLPQARPTSARPTSARPPSPKQPVSSPSPFRSRNGR